MSSLWVRVLLHSFFKRPIAAESRLCKKDSPSSGFFRVKVYNEHGMAQRNRTGMSPCEVVQKPPGGFCQTLPAAAGGGRPTQRYAAARELYRPGLVPPIVPLT
jgi:hypothetical protein